MSSITQTFNLGISAFTASLDQGDVLYIKLMLTSSIADVTLQPNYDFTASFTNPGNLTVAPTAISTGYITIPCPYLATGSAVGLTPGTNTSEIVFTPRISNLYGDDYQFTPNPVDSVNSTLYEYYGDVRYPFNPTTMDMVVMQLSDNTFFVGTIARVYKDISNQLRLVLTRSLPYTVIYGINSNTFKRFLLIKRYPNEQNVIVEFRKAPGSTSYGFIIPDTISEEVIASINSIQATVQTQLLSTDNTTFATIS